MINTGIRGKTREIVRGRNAKLYWVPPDASSGNISDGRELYPNALNQFLFEVTAFAIDMHFNNSPYDASGDSYQYELDQSFYCTLNLTQTVLRKASIDVLRRVLAWAQTDGTVQFGFQGVIEWADFAGALASAGGTPTVKTGDIIKVRDCIPTGTINVLSLQMGRHLERPMNFRCLSPFEFAVGDG